MNKSISIRDLQRVSSQTIAKLDGPTAITSGEETVAVLFPLKKANLPRLRAALLRAEKLSQGRDREADDAALAVFGPVETGDYSFAAQKAARPRTRRKK